VLVLCSVDADPQRAAALEDAGAQVERVAERQGRLDLGVALDLLGERNILSVLLECGSALNGAFLAQGLVDKIALFYSQAPLGEGAVSFAEGVTSPLLLEQRLHPVTRTVLGADTRVSGYLRDPWDASQLR